MPPDKHPDQNVRSAYQYNCVWAPLHHPALKWNRRPNAFRRHDDASSLRVVDQVAKHPRRKLQVHRLTHLKAINGDNGILPLAAGSGNEIIHRQHTAGSQPRVRSSCLGQALHTTQGPRS